MALEVDNESNNICKSCVILERELEINRAEREYYRDLLLTKVGLINSINSEPISDNDFKSVRKHVSLSRLRFDLEKKSHEQSVRPSVPVELTEAEKLFEEQYAISKETKSVQ